MFGEKEGSFGNVLLLMMGLIYHPETSSTNRQITLRKIPDQNYSDLPTGLFRDLYLCRGEI
jgi:hypothetical protein